MMLSGDCGDVCCGGLGFFACGDGGESDDGVIFDDVAVATGADVVAVVVMIGCCICICGGSVKHFASIEL